MGFDVDSSGRSHYHPRAFYIYLRANAVTDHGAPTAAGLPVFMHEYAHLIQDRCSLFGVVDFVHFTDSIQSLIKMLQSVGRLIALPMRTRPEAAKSWLAEIEAVRRVADPRKDWKNGVYWAYEKHEVRNVSVEYADGRYEFPLVIATFVDNLSGDTYEHEIGPREIKEAYSTAVQVLHGGQVVVDPDEFQYLSVERILARFGPVDERQRLVICHWALQDTFPGVRFSEMLAKLETLETIPPAEELYDLCRSWAREGDYTKKIEVADAQLAEIVRNQQASGVDDLYYQVLSWYRDVAMVGLRLNLNPDRRFPLDTFLGTPKNAPRNAFRNLMVEQPIPMVETSDGRIYSFGADERDSNMVFFIKCCVKALEQLWHCGDPTWRCPFYDACDGHRIPYKDHECLSRPWRKGIRRPACPYGAVAAYLQISDVDFAVG